MFKYLFLILFLLSSVIYSQEEAQEGYINLNNINFGEEGYVTQSGTFVTPLFAGFDTTGFMNSPYSNTWLQFDGLTRGKFARLVSTDPQVLGMYLPASRTDTGTITFWYKNNLPRKTGAWNISFNVGSGWGFAFNNNYGNGLEFNYQGIAGGLLIQTFSATDSLRRYYKVKVNNLGVSGARVRVYYSTDGTDSLKLDTTNSAWILTATGSLSFSPTIGTLNAQNNASDTTQQTTNTTNYASMELKDLSVRKEWGSSDSLYGVFKSLGFGQMLYDSSRMNTYSWDRGNWSATIGTQNFNWGLGLFGETALEINGSRQKDPTIWNGGGIPNSCVYSLGKGVAFFSTDSTYRESYTNASWLKIKGTDTFYCLGGHHNVINYSNTGNGKTYASNIARYNLTTNTWTAFNETTPPLNNIISGVDVNDSISYQCGIDSIRNVTGTKGVSQFNWNTGVYSTVTGIAMNDGGHGYELYKSGNAIFLGGSWTTLNGTANWGSVAVQRGYGNVWTKLGTGSSGSVWAFLVTPAGDTIIGGIFSTFNGVTVNSICKWNGTTAVPYGTGIKDSAGNAGIVWDLEWFKDELYVIGQFQVAGSVGCLNIAKWNGSSWVNLGDVYRSNPIFRGTITEGAVSPDGELMCLVGSFNKISYNGILRTSYNNVMYNGRDYFAMPTIDQRCEGVVWRGNFEVLIDGDETGAGGLDINNGGSNACHGVYVGR